MSNESDAHSVPVAQPQTVIPTGDNLVFQSFRAPRKTREEKVAIGEGLRAQVPHATLGRWVASAERADPIDVIIDSNHGRVPELVGVRMARMAASPYGFLRGAAAVMAADVARLPATGIMPVICGDAHLGNFGFYRSAEGELVIDLNDFDEAHVGCWEWDMRRLVASVWVAGRENGYREDECAESVLSCVASYRDAVAALAQQSLFARSFNHLDVARLTHEAGEKGLREEIQRAVKSARKQTSDRILPKFAKQDEGRLRIVLEPPLVTALADDEYEAVAAGLDAYVATLPAHWRRVLAGYSLVDIAHKVVGVGSVGLRAYIALLQGSDDVIFLQLKQSRRSVVAQYVHGDHAWHHHQGQRVVEYQQAVQTVSDPLLGWTTIGDHEYYVRQFRNMKGSVPLANLTATALTDYSGILGTLLANGHARTSGASLIAGYLGTSDAVGEAFATFAHAYADQTEADHEKLVAAIRTGRVPSV